MVILLWSSIVMASPYRKSIIHYLKPSLEFVVGEYSKIVDRISNGISNVLGSSMKIN
jgi:hypothetical protein